MHILIINGPNLNFLGIREPDIYGHATYEDLEDTLNAYAVEHHIDLEIRQTNFEGIIIDLIQYAYHQSFDAIILNPGALTHYSYAIFDAIKSVPIPVVEVHLTDIKKRVESFRHLSVIRPACIASFTGKGIESYKEALSYLIKEVSA